LHPFDIKTVLFAKHAQHVVLIHFPIALFTIGVLFDFLAHWTKRRQLDAAAYCNLFAAALTTIPVVITGIVAWQWELEGQKLKGILLMHLVMGCVSGVLICVVWLIHRRAQRRNGGILPAYRLPMEAAAVAIVTVTGHLGGFLSGVNGPG
jgi:uncharacterized membrane protein